MVPVEKKKEAVPGENAPGSITILGNPGMLFKDATTGEPIFPKLMLREGTDARSDLKESLGTVEKNADFEMKANAIWHICELAKEKKHADQIPHGEWTDAFSRISLFLASKDQRMRYCALVACTHMLEDTSLLKDDAVREAAGTFSPEAAIMLSHSLNASDGHVAANAAAVLDIVLDEHGDYPGRVRELIGDGKSGEDRGVARYLWTKIDALAEAALGYWEKKGKRKKK